jgi:hypothetical protein
MMGEDSTGGKAAVLVVLHACHRYSVVSLVGIRQTLNNILILTDVYHRKFLCTPGRLCLTGRRISGHFYST